jgi:hypothetical protein
MKDQLLNLAKLFKEISGTYKTPKYILQCAAFQNIGSSKLDNQRVIKLKVSMGLFKPILLAFGWTKKAKLGHK